MGASYSSVRVAWMQTMCVVPHRVEEEILEAENHGVPFAPVEPELEESSLIDTLHAEGLYDDLEEEVGEPLLIWVAGTDGEWILCAECADCYALMPYPGQAHNCPFGDTLPGPTVNISAVEVIPTTIQIESEQLLCDEALESSDSDSRDFTPDPV